MSALWFVLAFLALVGAGALIYVDKRHRTPRQPEREIWADDRGLDYVDAAPELEVAWRRGAFPTARRVVDVASGVYGEEPLYLFDIEDGSTVAAVQRPVPSPVVFDLRSPELPPPREPALKEFAVVGTRIAYSNDLAVARRVCDRRMVGFAESLPDFVDLLWTEDDWALISIPGTCGPDEWDDAIAIVSHFADLVRVLPPSRRAGSRPTAAHDPGHPHPHAR